MFYEKRHRLWQQNWGPGKLSAQSGCVFVLPPAFPGLSWPSWVQSKSQNLEKQSLYREVLWDWEKCIKEWCPGMEAQGKIPAQGPNSPWCENSLWSSPKLPILLRFPAIDHRNLAPNKRPHFNRSVINITTSSLDMVFCLSYFFPSLLY